MTGDYTPYPTRTGADLDIPSDVNAPNVALGRIRAGRYSVLAYNGVGDGVTDDAAHLASTDSANGGAGVSEVPAGNWRVASNTPLAHALTVPPGALLKPDAGVTLTLNGNLDAGAYPIFGGAGTVALGPGHHAYPEWWGADPTGLADSTAAINAMIAATCQGDPTTTVRTPTRMWIFHGKYKINSEVQIFSVLGAHLRGIGPGVTVFMPNGQTNALNIDGSAQSVYEDFSVEGGSCTNGVNLHWSGAYYRSTENNIFRNVAVQNGCVFVNAFAVGTDTDTDVSGTVFEKCVTQGAWTSGNVTTYQNGWLIGNGTSGNVLDHAFRDCQHGGCRYGVHSTGANFVWHDGQAEGNGTDFFVGQISTGAPYLISGVRSEGSSRLIDSGGGTTESLNMAVRDVVFNANAINADGKWINWNYGGVLTLDSVAVWNPGAVTPQVAVNPNSPSQTTVVVTNFGTQSTLAQSFSGNSGVRLVVKGFTQYDGSSQAAFPATDTPTVRKVSAAYTATLADTDIVADMTGAAYALTLPAASATTTMWAKELRLFIGTGTNTLTFTPSGGDTIVGPTTISGVAAWARLVNDGVSKWYVTT